MASGPITSWEIDGQTVETVSDFIFGGSKITADGDCSQEIKRRLLLGRKVMTNLDSIFKQKRHRCIERTFLDSEGEGEGGMIWENGIETCILSCRNEVPVYVRYRIQDARGWCVGMI